MPREAAARVRILHEDEDLLVADKPTGLLSVPTPGTHKSQQQLIIHAASAEDHLIAVDSPADLNDQGFKHAGTLACVSVAWSPDLDGKYAVAHAGGLVRVGSVREFILRSAAK